MSNPEQAGLARVDAAIVAIWAGLSLLARRLIGELPIAHTPQQAVLALLETAPSRMLWLPLVFYAGILLLAVPLFHRTYRQNSPQWSRLGLACGWLGFLLFAVGLSLNVVQATAAPLYVVGSTLSGGADLAGRLEAVWVADQVVSAAALVLLAGWMGAVSRAGQGPRQPALPRWFVLGGLVAALVTAIAGVAGVLSRGNLLTLDAGDGLILVHLWTGLLGSLLWQQGRDGRRGS